MIHLPPACPKYRDQSVAMRRLTSHNIWALSATRGTGVKKGGTGRKVELMGGTGNLLHSLLVVVGRITIFELACVVGGAYPQVPFVAECQSGCLRLGSELYLDGIASILESRRQTRDVRCLEREWRDEDGGAPISSLPDRSCELHFLRLGGCIGCSFEVSCDYEIH